MSFLYDGVKPIAVAACALVAAPVLAQTSSPSLCIVTMDGCPVPGGRIRMAVELGASEELIVAGQFSLTFDPAVLRLLGIRPGATCDPTSPFLFEFSRVVDELSGEVFYSVGEHPLETPQGTQGPARLACLEFAVLSPSAGTVCLVQRSNPADTILVNQFGHSVAIDNSGVCAADGSPSSLSCAPIEPPATCSCPETATDCGLLDGECSVGVCNEDTVACERIPINQDQPCDDDEECTSNDICIDGVCRGSGCQNPSLCIFADEVDCADSATRTATVRLGENNREIIGAQFSIDYDPDSLIFIDAKPGNECDPESPFTDQLAEIVDEEMGRVFYSVGVNPFAAGADVSAGATLACVEFGLIGISNPQVCLSAQLNPYLTILAGYEGSVPIYNAVDCPTHAPPPVISCDDFCIPVPAVSTWGLVLLTLILLVIEKCGFRNGADPSRVR